MLALHNGRAEMNRLIARVCTRTAANHQVPRGSDSDVEIGDKVLVYRDPPIIMCTGPHRVADIDKKSVTVIYDGKLSLYSLDKCKNTCQKIQVEVQ